MIYFIVAAVISISIAVVFFRKKWKAGSQLWIDRRKELLEGFSKGTFTQFAPVVRSFLDHEDEVLKDSALSEAIITLLIRGDFFPQAARLHSRAKSIFSKEPWILDLETDLLVKRRSTLDRDFHMLQESCIRRPDRLDWRKRFIDLVISTKVTTNIVVNMIYGYHQASGEVSLTRFLAETFEKKACFDKISKLIYEKMQQLEPKIVRWHYAIARSLQNMGDNKGFLEKMRLILGIEPNFAPALEALKNDSFRELIARQTGGENSGTTGPKISLSGRPGPRIVEDPLAMLDRNPPANRAHSLNPAKKHGQPVSPPEQQPAYRKDFTELLPNRYQKIEELGRGGMGIVYKAFDGVLKRWVAIKTLQEAVAVQQPDLSERFLRESQIMASLDHPTIPKVFELSPQPPYYLSIEFIEGKTLRGVIDQLMSAGFPNFREMLGYAADLSAGFHHACEKGVLHRDIKPENILIESAGKVRIIDFGLARQESLQNMTQSGIIVGTPWYIAPERLKGDPAAVSSEIFAFGVTLFEMFCGQKPFSGDNIFVILVQEPQMLRSFRPEIPQELEVLVHDCLSKNPQNRPSSFLEVHQELKGLIERSKES